MKRAPLIVLACTQWLSGCASTPPPAATVVTPERIASAARPGATRAELAQALGPTTHIDFASGRQVWLYHSAEGAGRWTEWVLLFERDGRLLKLRRRASDPFDPPAQH